jgi:hypothetical protein
LTVYITAVALITFLVVSQSDQLYVRESQSSGAHQFSAAAAAVKKQNEKMRKSGGLWRSIADRRTSEKVVEEEGAVKQKR